MEYIVFKHATAIVASFLVAAPSLAATPRDTLAGAAFAARDKASALVQIGQASAAAQATLAQAPADREAHLIRAMATAYRAKLEKSRSDAVAAGKMFAALAAADPRDPEAQAAIGAWNIDAVSQLGAMMAGMALGAHKGAGLAAMDRAVALGGNRAMFAGLSALLRLTLDPADARAVALAEAASRGSTPTSIDVVMQRAASAVLVPLRAGDTGAAATLARRLLPFGRLTG